MSLAKRIASDEIVHAPHLGPMVLSGSRGFESNGTYRFNASYLPLQVVIGLAHRDPEGPWAHVAERIPALVRHSSPHGFATDWIELSAGSVTPSAVGSYDAIRVYLWAGMLHPSTPGRDDLLQALPGMARYIRSQDAPPAKVASNGTVIDRRGPIGFSAALLPYLAALDDGRSERTQMARARSAHDANTGLYGKPARYYDQNLALFAIGWRERQFWFGADGDLQLAWAH
jgi:endoglucanase